MVIENKYIELGEYYEGLIMFRNADNKYGFLDISGKPVIAATYDDASDFSNGLAVVKVGTEYGYIDKTNKVAIEPQFISAEEFIGDLAKVYFANGSWGYINKSGKTVWNSPVIIAAAAKE